MYFSLISFLCYKFNYKIIISLTNFKKISFSELYDLDFAFVPYSCKDIKFKKRPRRYGQKIDLNLTGVDLQKHDYLISLSMLGSDSVNL